jgi:hypothetical protein
LAEVQKHPPAAIFVWVCTQLGISVAQFIPLGQPIKNEFFPTKDIFRVPEDTTGSFIVPTHKPPSAPESPPQLLPQHPKNQRQIIHRRPPRRRRQTLKPDRPIHQIPRQQPGHIRFPIEEYRDRLAK